MNPLSLLYIGHCYYNRAGVEEHIRDLQSALGDRYAISVAFPHHGALHLLSPDGTTQTFPGDPTPWPEAPFSQATTENSLAKIFALTKPDLIHVQHFINWPLSLLAMVTGVGVPTVLSFHDYFPITPHFTMQGTKDPHSVFTTEYSVALFGSDRSEYLSKRRAYLEEVFSKFSALVTPSEFLAKTLSIIYPAPFRVIPHGVAPFTPLPKSPSATLRFGYVGSLLPQKGWQILVKAFADLKIPPEVATLDLFGGDQNIVHPGIRFRGVYNKSDLPKICSEIDVAIIPSLFAETFSLVLSELWMGSVPTAASRIGAFQERIHEGTNGKLFTPGDISNLQETIGWFINDTSWRGWKLPQPKSVSTMANEYHTLYRELLNG